MKYFQGYKEITEPEILREQAWPVVEAYLERAIELASVFAICSEATKGERQLHASAAEQIREILEQWRESR